MAADEELGAYTNAALDNEFESEVKSPGDEILLRVHSLTLTGNRSPAATSTADNKASDSQVNGNMAAAEEEIDIGGDLPPNIRRNRPFSASSVSRQSTGSTRSRVSMSPSIVTSEYSSKNLFAYRPEILNKAIDNCSETMVREDPDGAVKGSWLLTEIDHWDHEMERLVLLTENSLLIIKYDFIKLHPVEGKRIPLTCISKVQIGDLTYPPKSLMPARDYGGVRIFFGNVGDVWFSQRWNPFSRAMPFVTLTHHMLAYNRLETETVTYNADDLAESLIMAAEAAHRKQNVENVEEDDDSRHVELDDNPIVVESYASLPALIFNQSRLGFYLERGGVSF